MEKVLGQIIDTSNFSVHDDLDEDVGDNGSAVPAALGARTSRVLREEHADLLLQDSRGRAVGTTSGTLCEIAASAACCGAEDEIARAAPEWLDCSLLVCEFRRELFDVEHNISVHVTDPKKYRRWRAEGLFMTTVSTSPWTVEK